MVSTRLRVKSSTVRRGLPGVLVSMKAGLVGAGPDDEASDLAAALGGDRRGRSAMAGTRWRVQREPRSETVLRIYRNTGPGHDQITGWGLPKATEPC